MSVLALSAATDTYPDPTFTNTSLPFGSSPSGKTGFTFPNNPAGLVYAVINMGSTGSNFTVVGQMGASNVGPTALTVSVPNIIGPFDPSKFSDSAGLVHVNLSSVTGVTGIGVVIIPAKSGFYSNPLHNPLESVAGAPDS